MVYYRLGAWYWFSGESNHVASMESPNDAGIHLTNERCLSLSDQFALLIGTDGFTFFSKLCREIYRLSRFWPF